MYRRLAYSIRSVPSGIKSLSKEIKRCGKKPALWLAPFVVHEESEVFRHHSDDWLVTHSDGSLLRVEDIAYEGGRSKSGYILDTTNPDVQEHLTHILTAMRKSGASSCLSWMPYIGAR